MQQSFESTSETDRTSPKKMSEEVSNERVHDSDEAVETTKTSSPSSSSSTSTEIKDLLSWRNPQRSGVALFALFLVWSNFAVFDLSILDVVLSLCCTYMVVGGISKALSTFNVQLPPQVAFLASPPQIHLNTQSLRSASDLLLDKLCNVLDKVNVLSRYDNIIASLVFLAQINLAFKFRFLFSPTLLCFFGMLAFAIYPLYQMKKNDVDSVYNQKVAPVLGKGQDFVKQQVSYLKRNTKGYEAVIPYAFGAVSLLALYIGFDYMSFSTLMFLSSVALVGLDLSQHAKVKLI